MSLYTQEEIEKLCKKCGIDIKQCFDDLNCINTTLRTHPSIKNKKALTQLMLSTEELIKLNGIIQHETSN